MRIAPILLLYLTMTSLAGQAQVILWEPDNLSAGQVSRLYVTGSGNVFAVTQGGLYRSTNKGQSWQQVFSEYVYGPVELPDGSLLASNYGNVIRSTDGGTTWTPGEDREVRSFFRDGTRILAGGAWGEFWSVTENGQKWTVLNQPVLDQDKRSLVADIYARGDMLVYKHVLSGLWISRDGGKTWNLRSYYSPPPFLYPVGDAAFLIHQFPGETSTALARTADFQTFTRVSNNPHYEPLAGVFRDDLFIVGGLEGPYVSFDGGKSWTLNAQGLADVLVHALTIDREGYIYAGTHKGVQRSKTPTVATVVESSDASLPFRLEAPAPNPFLTHTTFALTLGYPQQVRLEVFNTLGQRVCVLKDAVLPAGEHHFAFHAAGLPGGTYFLRASGESGSGLQRVVIVR